MMNILNIIRRILLLGALFIYISSKFSVTIESAIPYELKQLLGGLCLILCVPGLYKILKLYIGRIAGSSDIHLADKELPKWVIQGLIWEADLWRCIWLKIRR